MPNDDSKLEGPVPVRPQGRRRLVLCVAVFGVLVGVVLGLLVGERMLSAFKGDPRSAKAPTILFGFIAYFTGAFVKVIIDHFRQK